MGGIKNKLSKLSNRVKNLLSSLSLTERADERSLSGEVKTNKTKGSRLPSFSQPSKMPDGQISNTRKLNYLGLYAEKTIGSLRPITLTKYLSLACLSIAILSTLILNILSSYSYSKVNSNAEPVGNANTNTTETSTLANTSAISLSFTPISTPTSSPDTSNPANVSMQIPDGGGIATGGHTVEANVGSEIKDIHVALTMSDDDDRGLVNSNNSDILFTHPDLNCDLRSLCQLESGQFGFAVSGPYDSENGITYWQWDGGPKIDNLFSPDYEYMENDYSALFSRIPYPHELYEDAVPALILPGYTDDRDPVYKTNVYFAAALGDPESVPAGNYTTQVVYTITAKLHEPVIESIEPNTYELGSGTIGDNLANDGSLLITITGNYLSTVSRVYLTNADASVASAGIEYDCTNIQVASSTTLTCNIPTDTTNPAIEDAGTYNLTIVTEGGEDTLENGFTYKPALPEGMNQSTADYGEDGHVAVDYDENMIPITYTGNETTPEWVIADPSNNNSNTDLNWYDYTQKKWANAVTLTREGLKQYADAPVGTVIDEQYVLGYWVYIPRYAYEVMRRDASDKPVQPQNFSIVFQTSDQKNTPAKTCSTTSSHKNYRTDCNISTAYTTSSDNTTWATHPAFTWQYSQTSNGFSKTVELNGIWVGKFETSETDPYTTPENQTAALILPSVEANGSHFGWIIESIKRIGVQDRLNTGGGIQNSTSPEENWPWNSNHLAVSSAHVMKNSEWGAVSYLASSAFGTGIGNLKGNINYQLTGLGPTGRAYYYESSWPASTTGSIYGIYDMKGGRREMLAAAFSSDGIQSDQGYGSIINTPLKNTMREPYVNLYPASIFPAYEDSGIDFCTWETCGGQALHETLLQQYSNSEDIFSWLSEETGRSQFPTASNPWIERNMYLANDARGEIDDMFRFFNHTPGGSSTGQSCRSVLLPIDLSSIQN